MGGKIYTNPCGLFSNLVMLDQVVVEIPCVKKEERGKIPSD